jgi:O-antigen ligase
MLEVQSAQPGFKDQEACKKRNPVAVALITVMFALPICTGSALLHYFFFFLFLVFFIVYVFFQTRKYPFSLFKQLKTYHTFTYYLLMALCVFSLVSYLNVILGDAEEFRKTMATFRYVLYATLFAYAFSLSRFLLVNNIAYKSLFFAYMLGNIFLYLLFILVAHFSEGATNLGWGVDPPFGRHVRLISIGIEVAVIAAVTLFLVHKKSFIKELLLLLCILVCATFLITTGSRASMLSTLLTIFVLAVFGLAAKKMHYWKLGMMALTIFLSVWMAEIFPVHSWNGMQRAIEVSTVSVAVDKDASAYEVADTFTSGRMLVWSEAINAIKLSPLIGLGPNASIFFVKAPYAHDQPHNFILQFLIEWGIIGASLLIAILVSFAWHGIKNLPRAFQEEDTDYVLAAGVVFVLTVNGLTDGTYYHVQPIICMATAFAVFPFFSMKEKAVFNKHYKGVCSTEI